MVKLNSESLKRIHSNALSESFEALTVDGDTSPNDSSLLVASENKENFIKKNSTEEKKLEKAVKEIFRGTSRFIS